MPELGKKYTCYSCHTKFYDLGKPMPLCPKCGADQRDADEAPAYVAPRRSRVVEAPVVDDDEFAPAAPEAAEGDEDEGFVAAEEPERDDDADADEEEYDE
jgi:hypothetical protein